MDVKERVINEATKMFVRKGIKAIRMDDIASRLGISKRTIYELFGDKEQLIVACVERHQCLIDEKNRELTKDARNLIEEFLITIDYWEGNIDGNHNIMSDIKKYYPELYDDIIKRHKAHGYLKLKEKLEQGIKEGLLLPDVDLDLAIGVLTHSLYGIINHDWVYLMNVSEKVAIKYVVVYFFRGISTEKGRKLIDERYEKKHNK